MLEDRAQVFLKHRSPCYTAVGQWWSHVKGMNVRCGDCSQLEQSINSSELK